MSANAHIRYLRTFGMDNDSRNRAAILQANVLPVFAAIGGTVNAVTPTRRISIIGFAGADPNDIRIRRCNSNGTNGKHRLLVEYRIKANAVIVSLEYSSVGETDVEDERITQID